jgi:hypothetical protein
MMGGEPSQIAEIRVPPRPNPGPEPWEESASPGWWWLALVAVAIVLLALLLRTRRRARVSPGQVPADAGDLVERPVALHRLVSLANQLRDSLGARTGVNCAVFTTEELELLLRSNPIDDVPTDRLVRFCQTADRWKFASSGLSADHLAEAEAFAAGLIAAWDDGARSTMMGR